MIKTALTAALVLGTATVAFAEDSSSSFSFNIYPQATQQRVLEGRDVGLTGGQNVVIRSQTVDRAGNPYAGGGF